MAQLPFLMCNPGKELTTVSLPMTRPCDCALSPAFTELGGANERRAKKESANHEPQHKC